MKITRPKSAKGEPLEERFQRFARALMAVPKTEIDKATAHEKTNKPGGRKSEPNKK